MEKKLSVLLVEDDQDACNAIKNYIDELDDVVLVGTVNDSDKAIDCVKVYLPETIILDLELHQGGGDGLLFLNKLKLLDLPFRPFILVTTNNSSTYVYEYARQSGADFIMAKHQTDYSANKAVDFLRMMGIAIRNKISSDAPEHSTTESPEHKEKRIMRRISLELDFVGVSSKHIGYRYLVDAIKMSIDKAIGNICAAIGSEYGKTEASVERAMQNAIDKAWRTSNIEDLLKHYTAKISSDKGKPTITEFVCYYANKIRNEY